MPYGIIQNYPPPGRGSISCLSLVVVLSSTLINPPIKDERLSRPELMQVIDLPRVATEVSVIPDFSWLSWPSASLGTV